MDLHAEIHKNMEELAATFTEQMGRHDQKLQSATLATGPVDITNLAREFRDFKDLMWKTLGMLKSQLELVTRGLDRHETAARRKVLLVHGVEEAENEKPDIVFSDALASRLKLSAECLSAVRVVHRLGAKGNNHRPLLVRFATYSARCELWGVKRQLKGSGITVSEFLTKTRYEVFVAARKHFGLNNTWSSDGKVLVMLPDKSRHKVECWADLRPLTEKYPSKETPLPAGKGKKPAAVTAATSTRAQTRRAAHTQGVKK